VGNQSFRDIISDFTDAYILCNTGSERANIVALVIDRINSSGGRFLRRHQVSGKVSFAVPNVNNIISKY
jgi:hypothetical protein